MWLSAIFKPCWELIIRIIIEGSLSHLLSFSIWSLIRSNLSNNFVKLQVLYFPIVEVEIALGMILL